MRLTIDATLDYHFPERADVLLALEVAQMADQKLVDDRLTVTSATPLTPIEGQDGIGRRTWTAGEGPFFARYRATVDVSRKAPDLNRIAGVALRDLPGHVVPYLWPSRYVEPERFHDFVCDRFGHLQGGARIAAIAHWTQNELEYAPGNSDESTTAHDSFQRRKGICRDFAHVMIAMARGMDIPARMVSAYAFELDPADFHAVVEVYLDGGWYLVDPTGLAPVEGLVRMGVGRDATDISFMSIFGGSGAQMNAQSVRVTSAD